MLHRRKLPNNGIIAHLGIIGLHVDGGDNF